MSNTIRKPSPSIGVHASPWKVVATGGPKRRPDAEAVRRFMSAAFDPDRTYEVRSIPSGRSRSVSLRDLPGAVAAVCELADSSYTGIYYTLNPVSPELGDRAAKDADVVARRLFMIDCDPVKGEPKASATDDEKQAAFDLGDAVCEFLTRAGFPEPMMIDSGNGMQLLYACDLPNDSLSRVLVSGLLKALAAKFDNPGATIDRAVHNASRIAKLPGTWAQKGEGSPDRPHRIARTLSAPEVVEAVTASQIESLTLQLGSSRAAGEGLPVKPSGRGSPWNVVATMRPESGSLSDLDRARLHHAKADVSVSGQGGHATAYRVMCNWVRFDITDADVIFNESREWNSRCEPPWSEKELRHKIDDAIKNETRRDLRDAAPDARENGKAAVATPALQGDAGDEWGPIRRKSTPEVEPFPLRILPPAVQRMVEDVSVSVSCAIDFPATAAVATVASMIGASVSLRIKDGYYERASIYGAVVAPPSSGKSPALDMIASPMRAVARDLYKEFEAAKRTWEESPKEDRGMPPNLKRILTSEATVEALAPILAANPRGLSIFSDEITRLFLGFDAYKGGKGGDRTFYLAAWSGSYHCVDRAKHKDGPIEVARPMLNIFGGMTPDMLSAMEESEGRDDGFLARMLFCYPDPVERPYSDEGVPDGVAADWSAICWRLWNRQMREENGDSRPWTVDMTPEARKAWVEWVNAHRREQRTSDFQQSLDGAWGKLEAYGGRLALVLHLLDIASDPTSTVGRLPDLPRRIIDDMATLIAYFKSHARRVYAVMGGSRDKGGDDVQSIIRWILGGGRLDFSERDVSHGIRRFAKDRIALADSLAWLSSRSYIRPRKGEESGKKGRKPSPVYDVNPELFDLNPS